MSKVGKWKLNTVGVRLLTNSSVEIVQPFSKRPMTKLRESLPYTRNVFLPFLLYTQLRDRKDLT